MKSDASTKIKSKYSSTSYHDDKDKYYYCLENGTLISAYTSTYYTSDNIRILVTWTAGKKYYIKSMRLRISLDSSVSVDFGGENNVSLYIYYL